MIRSILGGSDCFEKNKNSHIYKLFQVLDCFYVDGIKKSPLHGPKHPNPQLTTICHGDSRPRYGAC